MILVPIQSPSWLLCSSVVVGFRVVGLRVVGLLVVGFDVAGEVGVTEGLDVVG